jgi:hypothetical protein
MIKIVKLVSGEELVAEIPHECLQNACEILRLKNPVRFVMSNEGLGVVPYCPFAKTQEINIEKRNVLFTADLEDEIQNAYNSQFGTGIVMANTLDLQGLKR